MALQIFRTKRIENEQEIDFGLKRCLTAWDLTFLGIGAIIGTGIVVLTGIAAATQAGIAMRVGNHSFRTTGITAYLKNGGALEKAAATR